MVQKAYAMSRALMEKQQNNGTELMKQKPILKDVPINQRKKKTKPILVNNEKNKSPKIVIVGASLAGLTCAYRLKQQGISTTIYKASNRVGGRCWTRRGDFEENQIVERGGELIDTDHTEIRELAKELGLVLDDLFITLVLIIPIYELSNMKEAIHLYKGEFNESIQETF